MKKLLLLSFVVLVGLVNAQDVIERPFIEVVGQSERLVTPDEIYMNVLLTADKVDEYQMLEMKVMKELLTLGLSADDITLADAQGNEVSSWFKSSFETQRLLLVKVSSATMVGDVIDGLREKGVTDVMVARVDYSSEEQLLNKLRVEAMQNAKLKSKLMLASVDAKLGMPISVKESYSGIRNDQVAYRMLAAPVKSEVTPMSFKKQRYTSEVTVRFEILK